jgi:hypothetical protein
VGDEIFHVKTACHSAKYFVFRRENDVCAYTLFYFSNGKVDFDDGMDARWIVGVAERPDDGAAIDPDDRAAEIPIVVVTLDVICSVLLYNL